MSTVIPVATAAGKLTALLEGKRGPRKWDYQLWRSNKSGEKLERLETVASGQVSLSNYRDHTWELGLNMRETQELDVFSDYVKLIVRLFDDVSNVWHEWPFGLYRFQAPKGSDSPVATTWDLTGHSLEQIVLDDVATAGYKAAAGSGVLSTVKSILTTRFGIASNRIRFPAADVALATDMFFTPWQDSESARYLRICNAILAAGGFYALYTDGEGRFRTKEIEDLADNEEAVTYGTDAEHDQLILGEVGWEYSDEEFANVFVVYAGDANSSPPVIGAAEYHSTKVADPNTYTSVVVDPDSAFTIERLGYPRQKEPEMLQNIVSTSVAKKLARRRLKIAAGMEFKLNLQTVFDPRRGPREVIRLDIERDDGTRLHQKKWRVINWSVGLDFEREPMTHELARHID